MSIRLLALAFLLGCAGISGARGQAVYEASLAVRESNSATLFAGKFWLTVDARGQADFQAAVTGPIPPGSTLTARFESPAAAIEVPLGQGAERIFSGCDPLGRNPYLRLSEPFPLITCPAFLTATFFQSQVEIPPALATQLAAQQGTIRIKVTFPGGGASEVTGTLLVTGVAAGRQFFLAPVDPAKVVAGNGVLRVTWASEVHTRYLVQLKSGLGAADWENAGFAVVATSTSTTIEIPTSDGGPQKFFRVLRLR